MKMLTPVEFTDGKVVLIDQTRLPGELIHVCLDNVEQVHHAIRDMVVRGAPAIGIAAAYGMCLCAISAKTLSREGFVRELSEAGAYLKTARPTAVNLSWAVDQILEMVGSLETHGMEELKNAVIAKARLIQSEDEAANMAIGGHLLDLFGEKRNILTHCNAGILATSKYGTATSAFYLGKERGVDFHVYADETRPRLQGSILTAYELMAGGIDVTVITDNSAAYLMSMGRIDAVVTGCDRVAANGDVANKIGTLGLSVLSKHYGIPFYIAAPVSSIDMSMEDGKSIPIEERGRQEVIRTFGVLTAPEETKVLNYAFDVTPHENITALVTERGIVRPPYLKNLKKMLAP
ncbi:MAG: S-methyl-5-thioribose-1-phosphate isomerase [Clostridia bacterium]